MATITLNINDELADQLRTEAKGNQISVEELVTRRAERLVDKQNYSAASRRNIIANEATIARIWDSPEEDAAWGNL